LPTRGARRLRPTLRCRVGVPARVSRTSAK
jgi:hypothetical protein